MDVIDDNYLVITLLVTVGMQMSFFAIAASFKFDKVTDIAGSMNFVLLAWLTYLFRESYHTRQTVITLLVTVWGLRLGLFLLYRVLKRGKDDRFDELRENFFAFLGFWIYQIFWVWVVSLPVTFVNAAKADADIGARDYIGWTLWGIGFIFEVLADHSKSAWNGNPENKGKLLKHGVWYYTRHPNYFGEITLWIGIFVSASSVFDKDGNTEYSYFSVFSPVLTIVLLMFLSGIPLGEERYDKRYGNDPDYVQYKTSTSPLIPMPPALYGSLPSCFKLCFCEFPIYSKHFQEEQESA